MNCKEAPIYQGDVIRMINDRTGVAIERQYEDSIDADFFESHLDQMDVHYQRWYGGKLLYEVNAPEN